MTNAVIRSLNQRSVGGLGWRLEGAALSFTRHQMSLFAESEVFLRIDGVKKPLRFRLSRGLF